MEIVEKSKEKISVVLDIDESLANAIRRSVSEIPTLAIDNVTFIKNDSALYDEVIAHRLGLTPLKIDGNLEEIENCTCKGKKCSKCTVQLKMKIAGPCTVYSKDLKSKANVIYDDIPIVILSNGQELELIAEAKLGKGTEHVKFTPGIAFYRDVVDIDVKENCECLSVCPKYLLKEKGKFKNVYDCDSCDLCLEECKKEGRDCVEIKKTGKIIFFVESFGQLDAGEVFIRAVGALNQNLKEISKVK
ncbi:DNA-directed RNA polymerase subunit D [Candidatus Woesearchaeota archaeon CG10_big_fil_rev_8_21_14_0_10_34_12]|nr:MAG: DNA-directed RNA polymerase subunit D [Candidatus Woesearchaeota archaeon CG10_big_fil_rev_8_21_14_0_10_34_12]